MARNEERAARVSIGQIHMLPGAGQTLRASGLFPCGNRDSPLPCASKRAGFDLTPACGSLAAIPVPLELAMSQHDWQRVLCGKSRSPQHHTKQMAQAHLRLRQSIALVMIALRSGSARAGDQPEVPWHPARPTHQNPARERPPGSCPQ